MNFDHGTFTPLVYSVFGSLAPECRVFYRNLCLKLADKNGEKYEDVISWVKCKLSFLCIKACLMCLRGSRKVCTDTYISEDFG